MFCPDCGAAIAEGRRFCGKCGCALDATGSESESRADSSTRSTVAHVSIAAHPASLRRKFGYALVVLLVVLGGVAWWWFHRPGPAYKVQDPGIYPFQGLSADGNTLKWGFIDADGKVLIQPTWDGVDIGDLVLGHSVAFSEGLCGVLKDGKWGYIDPSGNLVIANQFESAAPFVESLARIHLGNQIGYIDKTGHYVINPQFYDAGDFHGGLAVVRGDGGWGVINKAGIYVIKPRFQSADPDGFSEGLAGVCIEGKCGYIDHSGKYVVRPQFASVATFSEGLAEVQINGKIGYINTSGTLVINPQFDQATMFSGGHAVVSVSGHQGTINKQGSYVLNPGQYNMGVREGDIEDVSTSDGMGLIKTDGQWIVKPSKSLTGTGPIFGKAFLGMLGGQRNLIPISVSGKVLAGPYKDAMLDTLAQDIENETSAIQSVHTLTAAEVAYSGTYPSGFAASFNKLGPATGAPDQDHAGLIDASLATGNKDGYQFTVTIPAGTSTGGSNFNYFLVAKPTGGHAGRAFCADSSGTVHYAVPGQECTVTSPAL